MSKAVVSKVSSFKVVVRKVVGAVVGLALASPIDLLDAQAAPRVAASVIGNELSQLEAVRRAVWVSWFAGDTVALRRVLTPDLVAISPDAPHWQSLSQTLASAADFKESGGRLLKVTFDSTTTHRFGDVVVMFSHYAIVTQRGEKRSTQKGRATEVFVRRDGRWLHSSWQLDRL